MAAPKKTPPSSRRPTTRRTSPSAPPRAPARRRASKGRVVAPRKIDRIAAIVLAAGQGTRMKSALPKVVHEVADRAMVAYPVLAALDAGIGRIVVVVGHGRERVEQSLSARFGASLDVTTALQPEQRGTGDAVRCGLSGLTEFEGPVLILYGDTPLLEADALRALVDAYRTSRGPLALLTCELDDPKGYGRILRDGRGRVIAIREHRDCSPRELRVREVNPGVYAIDAAFLRDAIGKLTTNNAQGELYLTDVVALAAKAGGVASVSWPAASLRGINDRAELVAADRDMRLRIAHAHAVAGVTVRDPAGTYIGADVVIEPDVIIEPGVALRGKTRVGRGARIDVGSVLDDVDVGENAHIKPYSVATKSRIGARAQIGPFAHLRPETELADDVHIGNFVETKKSKLGRGSKANHLAYLGDGIIGEGVNVGAGTIFCNYDGFQKHVTRLEDGVFIGSDSQIVAPVTIGRGAYVASGTTVTKDVPPDALAISRVKQDNKEGYAARIRAQKLAAKQAAAARKTSE